MKIVKASSKYTRLHYKGCTADDSKTTSQPIAERVLQEAKDLLKHTARNVTALVCALVFSEGTHFNNFINKHLQLSPLKFRKN
ncbi:helix-turn-helix domain-containing protein [Pontibacter sp. CAU 1760]